MSRATEWRKVCPKMVRQNQIYAMEINTLFLVRQNGPLAFSVQDVNQSKPFEVRLGDPHKCSCKYYKIAADLCLHICWILLKKFQINTSDSVSFQKGMSVQELRNCISGRAKRYCKQRYPRIPVVDEYGIPKSYIKPVPKRTGRIHDTCPICLDGYKRNDNAVTYCKYSCGNVVHAKCIWMLVKHREIETDDSEAVEMLKCPLCRGNFNTIASLKVELRRLLAQRQKIQTIAEVPIHNVSCCFCKTNPVRGNLYRCLECDSLVLCAICLGSDDFRIYHGTHEYAIKKKSDGPWRHLGKVEEHLNAFNRNGNARRTTRDPPSRAKTKNQLLFSKGFSFNRSEYFDAYLICGICSTTIKNANILAATCGHYFHSDCLEEHLKTSEKCPLDKLRINQSLKQNNEKLNATKELRRQGVSLAPLEVRVSRMHLEERTKELGKEKPLHCANELARLQSYRNRIKKKGRKEGRPTTSFGKSTIDERLLSTQVNPLMTILMSPHLKQFIGQEKLETENTETDAKRRSLSSIKVRSLELPTDESTSASRLRNSSRVVNSVSGARRTRSRSTNNAQ